MEFDQIYTILDDPSKGNAKDWAERYQQNIAFQTYIVAPLQEEQFFYIWDDRTTEARFMCTFDTTEEEITNFGKKIRALLR